MSPDAPAPERRRRLQLSDGTLAAGVSVVALFAYVRTLAPGLTDDVDTAMFQFIGRVLGVAHNPGYPLYVLLTHVFSYVPIGTLAYRINLFSALLGAVAVALAYLIARRLGARQAIAVAAALGLAFGRVYWSQAVIAEVYTLNAAIVAGILLALLTWSDTRRPGWYFLAAALFAAGLGNHTTIVGFAPGIVLFILMIDRRFALSLKTLALTALVVIAGLSQYLFVLIRSGHPGAYVESRATTLGQLAGVMLGGQFKDRLFAFSARAVLMERVPMFVSDIFVPDLTVIGGAAAVIGLAWLLRRRLSAALLLGGGGAAILVFALNYSVIDTPVFLIPALMVTWLFAAVGAEQIARAVSARRALAGGATTLWLAVPCWLVAANFGVSDRSRDVSQAVELDRLFEALPPGASLVQEDFIADRMVMAKLLGDDRSRGHQIELAPLDTNALREKVRSGQPVFAFSKSSERLRLDGLDVAFDPLRLVEGPLSDFLSHLSDGVTVAIAVPGVHAAAFTTTAGASLASIGAPADLASLPPSTLAVVGVRGSRGAALASNRIASTLDVAAHGAIGGSGVAAPAEIHVRAEAFDAGILQGDREIVRTSEGVALATWNADGTLADTFVLEPSDRFEVPLSLGPLSAYALRGDSPHQRVATDGWSDLLNCVDSGSVLLHVDAGEKVVVYLSDDAPMMPRVFGTSDRAGVEVTSGATASSAGAPGELDAAAAAALDADGRVYRVEIDAFGPAVSVEIALGGIPRHAIGRVVRGGNGHDAEVYRLETRGLLRSPDRRSEVLRMGRDAQAQLTGTGWSAVDWDTAGPFRWMTETEARVVLPVTGHAARHLRIQALRDPRSPATSVTVRVNGRELPPQPLQSGWHVYGWELPAGEVGAGINEASVVVDRLSASASGRAGGKGVAVSEVRLVHDRS